MCLLAPNKNDGSKGYSCACPDDKRLSPEGLYCYDIAISSTLIVGTSTSLLEIEQVHLGRQKVKEIPLKNKISKISAIVYNSVSGKLSVFYTSLLFILNIGLPLRFRIGTEYTFTIVFFFFFLCWTFRLPY